VGGTIGPHLLDPDERLLRDGLDDVLRDALLEERLADLRERHQRWLHFEPRLLEDAGVLQVLDRERRARGSSGSRR
jgi:hypothetical protein